MKLLIIDNNRHLVEMLTAWLKTLGYQVERAYTPEQAETKWREQHPELVIVESALQGVDALALCRRLQSIHDALVLVVTEAKEIADEVRCLEAGADDYLRKPFLPDQLLARIHAVSRRMYASVEVSPSSVVYPYYMLKKEVQGSRKT